MRVLVNGILAAAGAKTGVGHYTAQLLRGLHALAPDDRIETFPGPKAAWAGAALRRLRPRRATSVGRGHFGWGALVLRRGRPALRALLALAFRLHGRGGAFDLYHEPNHIPLPTDLPTVVTVHDLSAVLHPEWHPADRAAEYHAEFAKGLARCRHVLAVSDFTRRELIETMGVPADRVTRVYNGVRPGLGPLPPDEVAASLRRLGLPPRYLLYLGTVEPRKNVMTLLRAYAGLPAPARSRCPLVLAGGWGWGSADVARFLDAEGRRLGVVYAGYLPEADLGAVLNGARALVYPSLYEGFGLPPVEMLACGGAVLCSTAAALAETVGGSARLIEPLDVDGWREALRLAAADDDWLAGLREGAVDAARPFSWERCAEQTLRVYRKVAGMPSTDVTPLSKAG